MSTLTQDLEPYTEPCGLVGLVPNPPDGSTDNGLLFTATSEVLKKVLGERQLIPGLEELALSAEVLPGVLSRWPLDVKGASITHWDDHCGVACASMPMAYRILCHGRATGWRFGGEFLARIIDFAPAVTMASGASPGFLGQLAACLGLLGNLWEPKQETSGKCLLYLKCRVYDWHTARGYPLLRLCVKLWRARMRRLYGDLSGLYTIYFGPDHPFTRHTVGVDF